MADYDRPRRLRSNRSRSSDPAVGTAMPQPDVSAPTWAHGVPHRRPSRAQTAQDVLDLAAFLGKVETARRQGRPTPPPQPMRDVLGAFHGSPAAQTTIQILAAAATARHVGAGSAGARRWETLAQDNFARLEAVRAQQRRQDQARYAATQTPPEQVRQRTTERAQAESEMDRRVFDAVAALALSYVAVQSLPPFGRLAELSHKHLAVAEADPDYVEATKTLRAPRQVPDGGVSENTTDSDVERRRDDTDHAAETRIDPGQEPADIDVQPSAAVVDEADMSGALEQVAAPPQKGSTDPNTLGSVLQSAGRGLSTAVGPVHGDDDVAPPLSPVNLSHLGQELLDALGAAMSGHPRSVTEILNIEREPDRSNEAAFVPDTTLDHGRDRAVTA